MEIALYFGSFNPIHVGHLIIANFVATHYTAKQVWLIVSPHNPLKHTSTLLNEYHRLHLTRIATEDNPLLRVSDVEFKLPRPSYTVDTLAYLKEKYPENSYSVIVGSDSFQNICKWKNYQKLLAENKIVVYKRPGFEVDKNFEGENVHVLEAPLLEISSTAIRQLIKNGKSIRYLVTDPVREEIEKNRYYR